MSCIASRLVASTKQVTLESLSHQMPACILLSIQAPYTILLYISECNQTFTASFAKFYCCRFAGVHQDYTAVLSWPRYPSPIPTTRWQKTFVYAEQPRLMPSRGPTQWPCKSHTFFLEKLRFIYVLYLSGISQILHILMSLSSKV